MQSNCSRHTVRRYGFLAVGTGCYATPAIPMSRLNSARWDFSRQSSMNFGSALDVAAKIVGVSRDFALLACCERDVAALLAGQASVVRSQAYYLDITHPLANKGAALSQFANLLAIPLAEIAVIGDGGNDVAMFERSGLSIAMGNAKPAVRQAADFVTNEQWR